MSKRIFYVLSFISFAFFCATFIACSVSGSEDSDYSKWSFSGTVVDSGNNQGLSKVTITYQEASGKVQTKMTDDEGNFFIDNLPFGSRSFTFNYIKVVGKDTLYYAPKVINVSSTNESSHMEGVVAQTSKIIQLSPLNASISGEFYINDVIHNQKVPVIDAQLTLIHNDTEYVNLFPETFLAKTDSQGKYTFKNLPADSGLSLQITPVFVEDQRYTLTSSALPRLIPNHNTDMGRLFLIRDTILEIPSIIKASNVMDKDFHGYSNLSTNVIPFYVFKENLSSMNLKVSVQGDSVVFDVNTVIKNDTLFIKHDEAFPSETSISVSIVAYGKESGERFAFDFVGDSSFVTGKGFYAVASNAWSNNENVKATFGIDDTLWVKFSDELATNLDRIQWNFVKDKTIYGNGYTKNANVWIHKDTLFVQILDKMMDSTRKPGDSAWMNLTVYAKNGSYIQNFILGTELKVPAKKKIIGSNVVDDSLKGYRGISPLIEPYYIFEEEISSSNLSVTVKADTTVLYVSPYIVKDTLFLAHDLAFPSESKITVNIVSYGKQSGERIAYELSGDSAFVTGRGIYAVTSNAWPSNKQFKSTFTIEDTIWVKFSSILAENVERIQWNAAKKASQTIYVNGGHANSTAWIKEDTLFVQMLQAMEDSCALGDSVGMNITVYAKDETYLQGFTLYTEFEPKPSSSSSEEPSSSSTTVIASSSSANE